MLRFAEHLLASAVGTASSRLVMGLLLERHSKNPRGAMKLLDDASAAIQYNRDLLQSAIDNVGQGIAVFDSEWQAHLLEPAFCELLASACRDRAGSARRWRRSIDAIAAHGRAPRRGVCPRCGATACARSPRRMSPSASALAVRDIVLELHLEHDARMAASS